jgi:biotin carboxylase
MNVVLLSPHFPLNFYNFAVGAHRVGLNVLGIGEAPYAMLRDELREALTEYYWVETMEDYNSLLRACAHFIHRYGRIHRLESHNEYWLETDARLRTDFNIPGLRLSDMEKTKHKSIMKQVFAGAGVEVARGQIMSTLAAAREFIAEVRYPVVFKPNVGVGAAGVFKICCDDELERFFAEKPGEDYLMEEFIPGQLYSFDGLADQNGQPVFYTAHFYQPGIMDVVNYDLDVFACSFREIPEGLEDAGLKAVRAFDVRERFFHIEFLRRDQDERWIAVETNMRPPGGRMLDVINYANNIDLYRQWANIVALNTFTAEYTRPYHCAFVGRKEHRKHKHTHAEILAALRPLIVHHESIAPVFARAMGNYGYLVRSPDMNVLQEAIEFILES